MKRLTLAALMIAVMAYPAEAKTWRGHWGGVSASTLQFLDGSKVRYCFKSQCIVRRYLGSPDSAIRFNWGAASFNFRKVSNGYSGTYTLGGQTSTIQMK